MNGGTAAGYPAGLAGEDIPLAARIVAIADVYDALSARRVYKEPFPHSECVEIIHRESGRQFDPELVRIFLDVAPQFEEIARRFEDEWGTCQPDSCIHPDAQTARRLTREQERTLLAALADCEIRNPSNRVPKSNGRFQAATALSRM